jgi:glycosyltransferase involved in cell wall biosynthesis
MSRVTIITDAWRPQVNGAVTTLANTIANLEKLGHCVHLVEPSQFANWPCPTYPEIALARANSRDLGRRIVASQPDYVLVATEGPLGLAARRALCSLSIPFSTASMTRFHDYLWMRFGLPRAITLRWLSWFHRPAGRVLAPTPTMQRFLQARGLTQASAWIPGVDVECFKPTRGPATALVENLPRPIHLYVGRLAVEKNIEAFLSLDLSGSKVVVGDGPAMARLRQRYPKTHFLGYRTAPEIAAICTASDVMVFPSRTDTFGHVMLEALACGLPVAAYPVQGPADILTDPAVGAVHEDLGTAIGLALRANRQACVAFVHRHFSWERSTLSLLAQLVPTRSTPMEQQHRKSAAPLSPEAEPAP